VKYEEEKLVHAKRGKSRVKREVGIDL